MPSFNPWKSLRRLTSGLVHRLSRNSEPSNNSQVTDRSSSHSAIVPDHPLTHSAVFPYQPLIHSGMSYDVSKVSEDIWTEVALFCGLLEVLHLERTCKYFRFILYDRVFWLHRLHALEQHEAPDLPRHTRISTLSVLELRRLVVRAHRRHLKYTGKAPFKLTRKTTVPLATSMLSSYNCKLLPGGTLLLSLTLIERKLQCFSVPGGKCIYTHKPKIIKQSDNRTQPEEYAYSVDCFGYDMQENGDVRVITVGNSPGSRTNSSSTSFASLEVFQISPQMKPPRRLYNGSREIPFDRTDNFVIARLCGDVLAVYRRNCLFLMFWREERSVAIVKVCIDILLQDARGNWLMLFRVESFHMCGIGRQLSHLHDAGRI
ncbi:hypothetical protein DFH11DRAFT_1113325 [Phellopilus nigrolimitatus]|nr:hypothetical protein DFH11DRAFT_1113325 [Phellopilus nigrolimitatus]